MNVKHFSTFLMEDHFPFVRPRILRWLWQQREALKIHQHRSASLPFLPSWRWEDEFRGFPRLQARQMKRRDRWWEPHLSLGTTAEVWDSGRPVISVCRWEEPCPHHKMLWCHITIRNAFCPLAASCCWTDVELWLGLWIKAPNWSFWKNDSLLFSFVLFS